MNSERSWSRLTLAVILAATAWRLVDLSDRSVWFDEGFTWQLIRFPWGEMIARAQRDVHPPLYYALLKLWTGVLGDSVYAMRLLSVVWFAVALVATARLCRESGEASSGRIGLIAVLILAVYPFLFRYSQEARMYTQEVALVILTSWLLLRALRESRRPGRWWLAYGVAAAALAYTHYFGLFMLVAQGVFAGGVLLAARVRRGDAPGWGARVRWALAGAVLAALLYAPWIPTQLRQQSQVSDDYWLGRATDASPLRWDVWRVLLYDALVDIQPIQGSFFNVPGPKSLAPVDGLIAGTLLLLAFLGWRGGRLGWLLVCGVVVPAVLAVVASFRIDRTIVETRFFLPPLALLLIGLAVALSRLRPFPLRWVAVSLITADMVIVALAYKKTLNTAEHTESRGICDYVAGHREPTDVVACASPSLFFPLKYHARDRFEIRQIRRRGIPLSHYHGGPVFQERDFLDWADFTGIKERRVWVVGTDPSLRALEFPDLWNLQAHLRFPESIRWQGDSALELWETAPDDQPADAPDPPRPPAAVQRTSTHKTTSPTGPPGRRGR